MNKFEKKALAKRAYRALVKMGEGRDKGLLNEIYDEEGNQYFPFYTDKNGRRIQYSPEWDASDLPWWQRHPISSIAAGLAAGPWGGPGGLVESPIGPPTVDNRAREDRLLSLDYGNLIDGNWTSPKSGLVGAGVGRSPYVRFLNKMYNDTRDAAYAYDVARMRLADQAPRMGSFLTNPNTALAGAAARIGANYLLGNSGGRKQSIGTTPVNKKD